MLCSDDFAAEYGTDERFEMCREILDTVFFVGTELDGVHDVRQYPWDISHFYQDMMEGGELDAHLQQGRYVHLFANTEAAMLTEAEKAKLGTTQDFLLAPVIIAATCARELPAKLAFKSVQHPELEISDMRRLRMGWAVPVHAMFNMHNSSAVSRVRVLTCSVRRETIDGLQRTNEEQFHRYTYAMPHIEIPRLARHHINSDADDRLGSVQFETDVRGLPCVFEYMRGGGPLREQVKDMAEEHGLDEDGPEIEKIIKEFTAYMKTTCAAVRKERDAALEAINNIPKKIQEDHDGIVLYKYYPSGPVSVQVHPPVNRFYGNADHVVARLREE